MERNITIEDVAKLAGVSKATVGRTIGNYGNVSDDTRTKVMEAVKQLNYRPNIMAQSLRGQSSKTIAVVLDSIRNNYCSHLISVLEKESDKRGYNVIVCNTNEDKKREIEHLQNMYSRFVDGIVLMSSFKNVDEIQKDYIDLYQGKIPIVFVDRTIEGLNLNVIQSNNKKISYIATKYLLDLGHEKIGIMATDHYSTVNERINGYKLALEEDGIAYQPNLINYSKDKRKELVAQTAKELMQKNPGITAIYILNNNLCAGTILALKDLRLQVPKDISLIVWDDDELNQLLDITTIIQPMEAIGKLAINKLIGTEKNKENVNKKEEILHSYIAYRKSCRRIN